MIFYLGTPEPVWLARVDVPWFISRRRLDRYKKLHRAVGRWALDSGGFTELTKYGAWQMTAAEYADRIARYVDEVGAPDWCAPQDWMCEPHMLAHTGLSIDTHQKLTVDNLLELRSLRPAAPVVPVLQGWDLNDYLACIDLYRDAGVDLFTEPLVGLGTVCRRQHTQEAAGIIQHLADLGLRLHGFGLKMTAVLATGDLLTSCDSMAWSLNARKLTKLTDCTHKGRSCANCMRWALLWRDALLAAAANPPPRQSRLF